MVLAWTNHVGLVINGKHEVARTELEINVPALIGIEKINALYGNVKVRIFPTINFQSFNELYLMLPNPYNITFYFSYPHLRKLELQVCRMQGWKNDCWHHNQNAAVSCKMSQMENVWIFCEKNLGQERMQGDFCCKIQIKICLKTLI